MANGGFLTTHVLDTALGQPASGLAIELVRVTLSGAESLVSVRTNTDGRTDAPLLAGADFVEGTYELRFAAGAYLDNAHGVSAERRFLDLVPIRFTIADATHHYHVPLLLAPFGYSTYRGS